MPRKANTCQVEFQILADLEHAAVFQQRLERVERGALRHLTGRDLAVKQPAALAALAMDSGT